METAIAEIKDEVAAALARKRHAKRTPEELSAAMRKAARARLDQTTPEQRSDQARKAALARHRIREQSPPRPAAAPDLPQVRAERIVLTLTASANGDAILVSEYAGVRPFRDSRVLVMRRRALSGAIPTPHPKIEIEGGVWTGSTSIEGDRRVTRIELGDDPLDIRVEQRLPGAFADSGAPEWSCHALYLPHVAGELVLTYTQPRAPLAWDARMWDGNGPMVHAAAGPVPGGVLTTSNRNRTATLTVPRPKAWQSYAVAWIDRRR